MKKILLGLATVGVFSAIAFSACGAADNCNSTSKCSADPARTTADIQTCKDTAAKYASSCNAEYVAYSNCFTANQKCTSANITDPLATVAACATQTDAFTKCVAAALTTDAGR
jgi:hypothetical protein